jgi:uncharacterized protein
LVSRIYTKIIQEYLYTYSCVLLSGPRQAGKSSLITAVTDAYSRPIEILDLEKDEDADKLRIPRQFFEGKRETLFILDEIHRMPSLLGVIRDVMGVPRTGIKFLLLGTGEDKMELLCRQLGSTMAVHLRIAPLNCNEVPSISDQLTHWFAGGFSVPLQMQDPELRPIWYASYLRGLAERDLPLSGLKEHPELVRRILPFIAESTGDELNKINISRQLEIRPEVLNKVLMAIVNTGILKQLHAFKGTESKRVIRSPRYFLTDTGLLHYLLGIKSPEQLLVSAYSSISWSNYVINQVLASCFAPFYTQFYQTHDGAGSELLIFKGKKPLCCITTQNSETPVIHRGFSTAAKDMNTKMNYIVIPGKDIDTPLRYNIRVCDVKTLCNRLEDLRQLKTPKVYIPRPPGDSGEHF